MSVEGGAESHGALSESLIGAASMDIAWREQTNADMMVLFIVPGKEIGAVSSSVLDGPEARGEGGPILHRLELGFGEGIVVGDLGARVRLGDTQIGQQQRNGL